MDAVWINQQSVAEAEADGYIVVNPESVVATHLSQVLYKYASQLIGQDDVQSLLDNLGQTAPHLVESVVPKLVPLHSLTAVLRVLLEEGVPISDLRSILEDLPPLAARNLGAIDTAEALRPRPAPLLIQQIAPLNQPLPVMTLDTELEHMLITMVRQSGEEGLILDNSLAEQLLKKISETSEKVSARGDKAVMVVSPAIRRQFAQLVRQHIEDLNVLAFTELPDSGRLKSWQPLAARPAKPPPSQDKEFVMTTITVTAADTAQAMDKIVERLGEDALILETVKRNGKIEMIATDSVDDAKPMEPAAVRYTRGTLSGLNIEIGGGGFTDLFDQQMINVVRDPAMLRPARLTILLGAPSKRTTIWIF